MLHDRILITGAAGFIGYHLCDRLLRSGATNITLLDNLNDYYDIRLKEARLRNLKEKYSGNFTFIKADITDISSIETMFEKNQFQVVINLAAQAGVRYAKINPRVYIQSNIDGFFNIIDTARKNDCKLFVYASSSSVYGGNTILPFRESDMCANPLSIYASSKIANEMIAESYANTFGLRCIGLRFFNVYGAWGRPDAAYYKWSEALASGDKIELRDNGEMYRDMTYVGDVTKSINMLIKKGLSKKGLRRTHEVYNIGNENPVRIGDLLDYITKKFDKKLTPDMIISTPRGAEETVMSRASTEKLRSDIGYAPNTKYQDAIDEFIEWYKTYMLKIKN